MSLKIGFSDTAYTGVGVRAAQSFAYLLTELPLLKYLTLEYSEGIDPITYIPSTVVNNTIVSLTIWIHDIKRVIPLLYRFQKLKVFTIHHHSSDRKRKGMRRDDIENYRSQLREKASIEYPITLRHVNVHKYEMTLEKVEQLLKLVIPPNLLALRLFASKRPAVRNQMPMRKPPFLDGVQWHDLLRKYLPSTMKRFYIEYEDIDDTMPRTNLARIKKEFIKHTGPTLSWEVSCSYDKDTKLMSFDLTFI
ncbi:unnamed protein product [Didymodactylos carnosus]|uniref:Uncharacterized protein n=1 Tax=Didymodactylos carnosus TaxID=1234261 RepID=A0A8S2F163_9BILA|nr:unnamed protein product [Didymodactylos carnosus]CAF4099753.1 unnamed protein product [Didymodactylos carnosus]